MKRIFVQGDRDANGIEEQVRQLGTLCRERNIGLNVGESGEIVRILAETGANVRVHMAKDETPNVEDGVSYEVVDCRAAARAAVGEMIIQAVGKDEHPRLVRAPSHPLAWGIRLAVLMSSDGFIFFPGSEGTLAHLVPILAFIAKGERDKSKPCRHVALVGWNRQNDVPALLHLMDIRGNRDWRQWISAYRLDELEDTLNFVALGFPPDEK